MAGSQRRPRGRLFTEQAGAAIDRRFTRPALYTSSPGSSADQRLRYRLPSLVRCSGERPMIERFPKLSEASTGRARLSRKGPLWLLGTSGGLRALSLRHDVLLDVEIVEFEDRYFPDAPSWALRGSSFLRSTRHDALPSYVERWPVKGGRYGRARMVDGKLTTALYDGPALVVATRHEPSARGWEYFEAHRSKGSGLPPFLAARITQRVADLLAAAHARGVKHGAVVLDQIRIRADGSPILVGWSSARARGSGGTHGDDLWSIRRALGFDPAVTSFEDDVFRLGCVLSTLLTGAPPFVEEGRRVRYQPPSARAFVPPALEAIVGRICDPAQEWTSSAAEIAASLAALLLESEPPVSSAVRALESGDLPSFADWLACHNNNAAALHPALVGAARRLVVDPLANGDPPPPFAELLIAVSEAARSVVEGAARDRSLSHFSREAAITLLEQAGYPDAAALSYKLAEQEGQTTVRQGSSPRPVIVRCSSVGAAQGDQTLCPHAWTSLQGEPILVPAQPAQGDTPYRPARLERICPLCGPVAVIDSAWYVGDPPAAGPPLELILEGAPAGSATIVLERGWPYEFGSTPTAQFFVEGLDADHASLWLPDGRGNLMVIWATLATLGLGNPRTAMMVASPGARPGRTLRFGPVALRVAGPGRIELTCDPGTSVTFRPPGARNG